MVTICGASEGVMPPGTRVPSEEQKQSGRLHCKKGEAGRLRNSFKTRACVQWCSSYIGEVAGGGGVRVVVRVAPSLVAQVKAVRVAVAEERGGEAGAVGAGALAGRTDGLLCVEQGLRCRHLGRHVAVVHHVLEVAYLPQVV